MLKPAFQHSCLRLASLSDNLKFDTLVSSVAIAHISCDIQHTVQCVHRVWTSQLVLCLALFEACIHKKVF